MSTGLGLPQGSTRHPPVSNRIHPFAVVLDELDQPLFGLAGGNVALDALLADVEADLAGAGAGVGTRRIEMGALPV